MVGVTKHCSSATKEENQEEEDVCVGDLGLGVCVCVRGAHTYTYKAWESDMFFSRRRRAKKENQSAFS